MKKYIYISLAALLAFSSCNFLKEDPHTKYPLSKYFNDEEEAMLYLYGAYSQVKNTVFGTDFMYLTDTMTDDIDYTNTNISRKDVSGLTLSSTNSLVKSVWTKFYAVIEQCNILIDQMTKKPDLSPMNAKMMIAEGRFMRAWSYFNLVQLWGDVPLVTIPVYNIETDNIMPKRAEKGQVLDFIVSELEDVSSILPDTPGSVSVLSGITYKFTISKAAAKLLLGKVYQFMGQNEDVIETLSYFMEGAEPSVKFELCSHFNYIYDTRYKDVEERSKEILWEMVASAETSLNNTWHREVAPSELQGPAGETLLGNTNGYQSYNPSYNLIKNYSNNDLRYLEGFQFTSSSRPHFLKGYDTETLNQNLGGANVIILRVADAYLTLAESYARMSNGEMARKLVNVVRERAQLTPLESSVAGDDLLDAILLERRLEFAGEGAYRLYDLRRTGKYVETMAAFNAENQELSLDAATANFVNPTSGKKTGNLNIPFFYVTKNATEKHLLLPIPNDERISNPNLTQNPMWN